MLTTFHGTCLEWCDWNLPVEIGFLKVCPGWNSFSMSSPRIFCERRYFLLTALWVLWIWSAYLHTFASGFMAKKKKNRWPHVFRPHTVFIPAVISVLLCIGVGLICVVLFVSSVQELNLIPLRCLSVLFSGSFSYKVITVCSLVFPVVFSRSFWLLNLIYIKV